MGILSNHFNFLNTLTHDSDIDEWTIESGKPLKRAGYTWSVSVSNKKVGSGAGWYSFDALINIAMTIDELSYAPTTYAEILRQNLFRQLYQIRTRSINYIYGVETVVPHMEDSFPCQECGLILPTSQITIDHKRPQAGGETEAVAKMLRMLGMTVAGPVGYKGQQLQEGVQRAQGAHVYAFGLQRMMEGSMEPVPTRPGRPAKGPATSSVADRYSLNWQGSLFYSVAKELKCVPDLEARCMHSLVNLRPLCTPCNSRRGNPVKFV